MNTSDSSNPITYSIEWKNRMAGIDRSAWDALALPLKTPLLEWDWLWLLEESGSVRPETGWLPYHLTVWSGTELVGAAPLYIKGHSSGEFVFDHPWADLAERLGIKYYPKLVGMSPFSPVIGYRFLIAPHHDEERITRLMTAAIDRFCIENRLSGCSFLFVDPVWRERIETLGYTSWRHHSYVWKNNDFETFDDYLAAFNANQRRNIKRERKSTRRQGITIKALTGSQIQPDLFPLMYDFYARTNDQYGPWGCKYLTAEFFEGLSASYRHRLLLMAAFEKDSQTGLPVGMSFLLHKKDQLYGRYWGSSKPLNHLHFNACYYRPIEWAIKHGILRFDPGMGSAHKVRRGFASVANHSTHRFYDTRLSQILQLHINEINNQEQQQIDALNDALPFAHR
jgi:predicted N-acyltransferase